MLLSWSDLPVSDCCDQSGGGESADARHFGDCATRGFLFLPGADALLELTDIVIKRVDAFGQIRFTLRAVNCSVGSWVHNQRRLHFADNAPDLVEIGQVHLAAIKRYNTAKPLLAGCQLEPDLTIDAREQDDSLSVADHPGSSHEVFGIQEAIAGGVLGGEQRLEVDRPFNSNLRIVPKNGALMQGIPMVGD